MLLWIVDLKLFEIGVAIEELLMIGDAVVLDPIVGTDEAIRKPADVSFPVTDKKIEIMRPVAHGSGRFASYCRQHCQFQDSEPISRANFHEFNGLKSRRW